jgi:hypothetical protein
LQARPKILAVTARSCNKPWSIAMSVPCHRRRFIQILPLAGAGLLAACSDKPAPTPAPAPAPAPVPAEPPPPAAEAPTQAADALPMVDEADPTAQSLSYVADNTRVDRVRHPTFSPEQNCANCALYQGAAGAQAGGCPLFAGKWVAAEGWCSAWARRS